MPLGWTFWRAHGRAPLPLIGLLGPVGFYAAFEATDPDTGSLSGTGRSQTVSYRPPATTK
jgi:hypothetical protein